MRTIVAGLLFLVAGCASPDLRTETSTANTRDEFIERVVMADKNASKINAATRQCIVDEATKILPADFLAAIDAYVANKTQENWDNLNRVDKSIDWDAMGPQADQIGIDCRRKHGA